jgi:SAM-dependent methyltransferase
MDAGEAAVEAINDLSLLTRRKLRALRSGQAATFLMDHAAAELGDRLAAITRRFPEAATLFTLTGAVQRVLLESGKIDHVTALEAAPELLQGRHGQVAPGEALLLAPASLDLAVSLLSLHEFNDLPGVLIQIRRALKPDGLLLAALPGSGTLQELRESLLAAEAETSPGVSPRVMPFVDVRDAGALLQRAGFALPVTDLEPLTVRYDTLFDLMRDLRMMGATNALLGRARAPSARRLFLRAAEIYAARFADPDGRIRATFNIVWLSGWAPHESQQKPLKPGSAEVSLATVLGKKPAN